MKTSYDVKLTIIFEDPDGTREELTARAARCEAGLIRRDDPYQDMARSLAMIRNLDSFIERLDYDFALEAELLRDIRITKDPLPNGADRWRQAEQLLTGQEA